MKKANKFRVGDIVTYNSRGKKLKTHAGIGKFEGQLFAVSLIKGNNAKVIRYGVKKKILDFNLHTKYLDMIKPGSRHPLTTIFADN